LSGQNKWLLRLYVDIFCLHLWRLGRLLQGMDYRDEWQEFFDHLAAEVKAQSSLGD
jgi:hypothetical protein